MTDLLVNKLGSSPYLFNNRIYYTVYEKAIKQTWRWSTYVIVEIHKCLSYIKKKLNMKIIRITPSYLFFSYIYYMFFYYFPNDSWAIFFSRNKTVINHCILYKYDFKFAQWYECILCQRNIYFKFVFNRLNFISICLLL